MVFLLAPRFPPPRADEHNLRAFVTCVITHMGEVAENYSAMFKTMAGLLQRRVDRLIGE